MFFQQWTGVNAILYYAPKIFNALGLTGNTTSLLATGVVGIVYVPVSFPAAFPAFLSFISSLSIALFSLFPLPTSSNTLPRSMHLATYPTVIWIDNLGRKPVLVSGAYLMAA
jgi:hypothetical protein